MKKIDSLIFGFVMLFAAGLILSLFADDRLMTVDSASPDRRKITGISVTNNQIDTTNSILPHAIVGVTNFSGTGTAYPVKIDPATGKIASSLLGSSSGSGITLVSTNSGDSFTAGAGYNYSTMFTLTTTATTGMVVVVAQAYSPNFNGGWAGIRITDANTNNIASVVHTDYGDSGAVNVPYKYNVTGVDLLTGSTKTYKLEVFSAAGSRVWSTNQSSSVDGSPFDTRTHYLKIIQIPP